MTYTCHVCGAQCTSYTVLGVKVLCVPCADKRKPDTTPVQADDECAPVLDYAQMRSNADDRRRR